MERQKVLRLKRKEERQHVSDVMLFMLWQRLFLACEARRMLKTDAAGTMAAGRTGGNEKKEESLLRSGKAEDQKNEALPENEAGTETSCICKAGR